MTKQLLREDLRFIHSHWDFYIGHELSSLPFRGERKRTRERTKNKWSARKEDRGSMNGSVQMNKRTDLKKKKKKNMGQKVKRDDERLHTVKMH